MATNNAVNKLGEAPIGSIARYDFAAPANSGWLECDGSVVNQATYPELYSIIGHTYDVPFNLPFTNGTSNFGGKSIAGLYYGSDGYWVITGGYDPSTPKWYTGTQTDPTAGFTVVDHGASFGQAGAYFNGTHWVSGYYTSETDRGMATATDPTSTWTKNNLSSVEPVNPYYGNGYWVAGGTGGVLYTATNPTGTWTSRTSGFGSSRIWDLFYGNGYWVTVGDDGKLFTATDPTGTWTSRTSGFSTDVIYGVYYANGYWVAVGANGKLTTATDPTGTWTARTSGFGTDLIRDVYYDRGLWVTVGDSGKMFVAIDPTGTWTEISDGLGSGQINLVRYGNGYWVVTQLAGVLSYAVSKLDASTQFCLPNIADKLIRAK